jgi:hypothetical protein
MERAKGQPSGTDDQKRLGGSGMCHEEKLLGSEELPMVQQPNDCTLGFFDHKLV